MNERQLIPAQSHSEVRSVFYLWNESRAASKSELKLIVTPIQKGQLIIHRTPSNEGKLLAMGEHLLGELVGVRALTMIHGICLTSFDTTFPLSAESALSCTIMRFVSLGSAEDHFRNPMNTFVLAVSKGYTPYGLLGQKSHAHLTLQKHNPLVHTHVQSHAPNTPKSQTGNLLHPLTKYRPNQTLPKNSAVHPAAGWCHCVKERQMTKRKAQHHLKSQLRPCLFGNKGVALSSV